MRVLSTLLMAGWFLVACSQAASTAEALIARGDAESQQQRFSSAIANFHQAEAMAPQNVPVLLRLARTYSDLVDQTKKREDAEKSLAYAQRALALDPKSAKARLGIALAYGKLTDFVGNKAKLEYSRLVKDEVEKSLALDPTDGFGWYLLGRWHFGVANVNGVLKLLARVVYGGLPPASNEEAARCLRKAVELTPHELEPHSGLARALTALGRTEEARKEWRIVLTFKPVDEEELTDQSEARKALAQ